MWMVFVYGRGRVLGVSIEFERFDDATLWALCVEKAGASSGTCPDCGGRVPGFEAKDVRATAVYKVGSEKWEAAAQQVEALHKKHAALN